ncbi:MAG: STAS domain-containing protein [Alphaproteobacteria bacterium]|nr:STAS domain-containing protein [Alphaproteobacteria bacterium]
MNYKTVNIKDGVEVQLSGSFTFRDHDTFFEVVSMIKTGYNKKMVFNFSDCDFLDSAALGMLVIAHDEAAAKEVALTIKGAKGKVKDVLYAARFDTLYDFED